MHAYTKARDYQISRYVGMQDFSNELEQNINPNNPEPGVSKRIVEEPLRRRSLIFLLNKYFQ